MTPWAEEMNRRQSAGLCRLCREPQVPARALCQRHLEEQRDRAMAKRKKKLGKGQCVEFGCSRPKARTVQRCNKCKSEFAAYYRRWYEKNRKGK